jgi:hypothetical protein
MSIRIMGKRTAVLILTSVLFATAARAQQPGAAEHDSAELAKHLSNPIASLVSVPLQFNWEQSVGPSDLTRFILNVQPVMPFSVNEDVNLIVRVIAPLISQPPLVAEGEPTFGIGGVTTSFFVSPSHSTQRLDVAHAAHRTSHVARRTST